MYADIRLIDPWQDEDPDPDPDPVWAVAFERKQGEGIKVKKID
jgi:hypothetical protein